MYHVKTYNQIHPHGLKILQDNACITLNEDEKKETAQAILLRSHQLAEPEIGPQIEVIVRAGVGTCNIPSDLMAQRGIPVLNTPGANANAVKELVIASMLMLSRNLNPALAAVDSLLKQKPQDLNQKVEAIKKQFVGQELMHKKIGVIGLGAIGVQVANTCRQLGMRVYGFDPYMTVRNSWQLSPNVELCEHIQSVLSSCDFITLHLPLTESTEHFIDADKIKQMSPHTTLLNFSRGKIVDHAAVIKAIAEDRLHYYISDFPAAQDHTHPRIISFPHLGASTGESETNCATMACQQLIDYLRYGSTTHCVNLPVVQLGPIAHGHRLCIFNQNKPNMVSQITELLGNENINIAALQNQSRADHAYTVIDVEQEINEALLKKIHQLDGIRKVRVLSAPRKP